MRGKGRVLVCAGAGCISSGCQRLAEALRQRIEEAGLDGQFDVVETGCVGSCDLGPVVVVESDGTFYARVKPEDAPDIVTRHLVWGRPVERLLHTPEAGGKSA
ncbi:MAG: (2Fe-2S) ferredoxin domain-containing protein, partial [Limnochordia bacterium]